VADENLKDFSTGWIQMGVVLFCMITFSTLFMLANNPDGLGEEAATQLGITGANLSSSIFLVTDESDALLNISAKTDPTEGYLGSRDSVATSYGAMGLAKNFFTSSKSLISWIFSGPIGQMLLTIMAGLFSIASIFFIIKLIRNGT